MFVNRAYVLLLEAENREWKIRFVELQKKLDAMTNTMFAVQGMPAPFVSEAPMEATPPRETDQEFLAKLEAAAALDSGDVDTIDEIAGH